MTPKQGEKRRSARKYLKYPAQLDLMDGAPAHRCALSDISETGARIVVPEIARMPSQVTLVLTATGVTRRCRVAWHRDKEVGLEFILPTEEPQPLHNRSLHT